METFLVTPVDDDLVEEVTASGAGDAARQVSEDEFSDWGWESQDAWPRRYIVTKFDGTEPVEVEVGLDLSPEFWPYVVAERPDLAPDYIPTDPNQQSLFGDKDDQEA